MVSRYLPSHAGNTAYGKRICPSLPGPTPRLGYAHGLLAVPASLAVTWWRALGRSHHARALTVHQAVLLFDAAPVAEAYHLVYGVCAPQAVIEVLEALVDEGQLPRSQATAIEEAVLRNVDREGEWR
jgi:hypothetical protein